MTSSLRRVLFVILFIGHPSAARSQVEPAVRDSAGVRIVDLETQLPELTTSWRLSATASVTIGVADGPSEYTLHLAWSATRLADERIVVVDGGSRELRFYGPDGVFQRAVGGHGEGPGEFTVLGRVLSIRRRRLLATDLALPRLTVFDDQGELIRTISLPEPLLVLARVSGGTPEGHLLISALDSQPGPQRVAPRDTLVFFNFAVETGDMRRVGRFAGRQHFYQEAPGAGLARWEVPFTSTVHAAVVGDQILIAAPDDGTIRVYGLGGELTSVFVWRRELERVTPQAVKSFKEHGLATAEDEGARRMRARAYEEIPFPGQIPAIAGLEADAEGRLWVREFAAPWEDGPQRWVVVDVAGRALARVEIPANLRLLEIGADYVLGRWTDEFDVESIRLFDLLTAEAGRENGARNGR